MVALAAGGGALSATAGQVSPNLTIVTKAKKSDKIQKTGFTALLKRSAENWGRGLKRLIAQAHQPKRQNHIARGRSGKAILTSSTMPSMECMHLRIEGGPSYAVLLSGEQAICRHYKEGFTKDGGADAEALAVPWRGAHASGPSYALSLPRFPRFLDWLRPTAWLSSRAPHGETGYGPARLALARAGDIPLKKHRSGLSDNITPKLAEGSASGFHFTIDPVDACGSLAHGILGSGSALSSHRSRNNRA